MTSELSGGRVAMAGNPHPGLEPPTLGRYLLQIRELKGLSREKACAHIPLSAAYLGQIESGVRVPRPEALKFLAIGYELSSAQFKHLRNLREPSLDLVGHEQMRARLRATPAVLERLDDLARAHMLAGYFDPLWHVLVANHWLYELFPDLDRAGNLVVWHFLPVAKDILLEWEREAHVMVQMLKAAVGHHRKSALAQQLLTRLGRNEDFYRLWTTSTEIAYGRHATEHLHLRMGENRLSSISIETSTIDDGNTYYRMFLGVCKPTSATGRRPR
ncbi:helix-turn-helix domain-containing protein [Nocardia sp. CA-107356]|uniref:helix-turn-helix domain-containing protein n=1 Tax=Nocardia sp. CA-107356 TaxID=3239972 RepID=UPI003D89EFF5